jgi:hypothetical protein
MRVKRIGVRASNLDITMPPLWTTNFNQIALHDVDVGGQLQITIGGLDELRSGHRVSLVSRATPEQECHYCAERADDRTDRHLEHTSDDTAIINTRKGECYVCAQRGPCEQHNANTSTYRDGAACWT